MACCKSILALVWYARPKLFSQSNLPLARRSRVRYPAARLEATFQPSPQSNLGKMVYSTILVTLPSSDYLGARA